jgi:hypothetical protein
MTLTRAQDVQYYATQTSHSKQFDNYETLVATSAQDPQLKLYRSSTRARAWLLKPCVVATHRKRTAAAQQL